MAIICTICQKKQSGWIEDYPLSEEYPGQRICATCQRHLQMLREGTPDADNEARAYYTGQLKMVTADHARQVIEEAMNYRQKQQELHEQAEREEKERLRQEELARQKVAEEERARREAERKVRAAEWRERLRRTGEDCYYEYNVLRLEDNTALGFLTGSQVNISRMAQELNDLGREGWRLVAAYTNELGKNSSAFGGLGMNATVDEHILIFERRVQL